MVKFFIYCIAGLLCVLGILFLLKIMGVIKTPTCVFKEVSVFRRNVIISSCSLNFPDKKFYFNVNSKAQHFKLNKKYRLGQISLRKGGLYSGSNIIESPNQKYFLVGVNRDVYRLDFLDSETPFKKKYELPKNMQIGKNIKASNRKLFFMYHNKIFEYYYCIWNFINNKIETEMNFNCMGDIVYKESSSFDQFILVSNGLKKTPDGLLSTGYNKVDYNKELGWLFSNESLASSDNLNNKIIYHDGRLEKVIAFGYGASWGNNKIIYYMKGKRELWRTDLYGHKKLIFRGSKDFQLCEEIVTNEDRSILTLHYRANGLGGAVIFDLVNEEYSTVLLPAISLKVFSTVIK